MRGDFESRIARAHHLAAKLSASASLLTFYARIAALQSRIYADIPSTPASAHFPALLDLVKSHAPEPLVLYAQNHLQTQPERDALLASVPMSPEARFFARVLLQPQAEHQAASAQFIPTTSSPACPFCDSKPLAAILRGEGDGAKRSLLCSLCATEWPFRRVLCPACAEEQKDHLPIFTTAEILHVRVEACDTCHMYVKSVDLTKDGFAIPEVDELAAVTLDVWADEHGYTKLEPNILGI